MKCASVKLASAPISTKDVYTEGYNAGMRAALASQGMDVVGQRVTITDNSLKDMIRIAYGVEGLPDLRPSLDFRREVLCGPGTSLTLYSAK